MTESSVLQNKRNIILISSVILALLSSWIIYHYATREEPPKIYIVSVDLKTTYKLKPKTRGGDPYPVVSFYLTGEIFDISQYGRVEILNETRTGLRLLEELDENGLILEVERRRRMPEKEQKIRLNKVDYLVEMPYKPGDVPDYVIEVEKLKKGKKYVLCEDVPWQHKPIEYLLALTKQ